MTHPALKPAPAHALGTENVSRAGVLLPLPLAGAYDYALPKGVVAKRGALVRAPFGKRELLGVVWGEAEGAVSEKKLREAVPVAGAQVLPPALLDFLAWVSRYTLAPLGAVLALALRVPAAFDAEMPRQAYKIGRVKPARLTEARARVLSFMEDGLARGQAEIAQASGVTPAVVKALAEAGALERVALPEFVPLPVPDPDFESVVLSPDQARAATHLRESVKATKFSASFLDGVTGSGKTETYFEAIAEALGQDKQVLILLPEIALTVQFLDRFAARFGCRPAEWHSDLTPRERKRVYRAVLDGSARVVAGARSALFLPFSSLGLIVVDEEHEQAYKQEEGVIYHARDMAVVRARLEHCAIVLASATPSLETYINAKSGRYEWLKLSRRHGVAEMPEVKLIDLRAHRGEAGQWISPPLREALGETLAAGEQALLFLNRRGYAPLTLCAACGHKETCRNCSAWLVEHRYRGRLICHHCGYEADQPKACPQCGAEKSFVACGPGVERVAEEFRAAFPEARVAVASSDTMEAPNAIQAAITAMSKREIDVLIGTQIVAKGHHFPQLTLAGVIDADLGGAAGDPRAAERSFQLLHQVSGRAGRAEKPGLVLIQTRNPDDPVMKALASGDRDAFLEEEAAARERMGTPPFGRLASLILAGTDAEKVRATARALATAAPKAKGITVWGPSPAFYQVLRGRTRERLLVQAGRSIDIQKYLREWLAEVKILSGVRLTVDVDPISFF
jgi:primosomal protein N' (replication factor Y)